MRIFAAIVFSLFLVGCYEVERPVPIFAPQPPIFLAPHEEHHDHDRQYRYWDWDRHHYKMVK